MYTTVFEIVLSCRGHFQKDNILINIRLIFQILLILTQVFGLYSNFFVTKAHAVAFQEVHHGDDGWHGHVEQIAQQRCEDHEDTSVGHVVENYPKTLVDIFQVQDNSIGQVILKLKISRGINQLHPCSPRGCPTQTLHLYNLFHAMSPTGSGG